MALVHLVHTATTSGANGQVLQLCSQKTPRHWIEMATNAWQIVTGNVQRLGLPCVVLTFLLKVLLP